MPRLPVDPRSVNPQLPAFQTYRGPFERSINSISRVTEGMGQLAAQTFDDVGRRAKQNALNQLSEEMIAHLEAIDEDKSQVDGLTEGFEKAFGDRVAALGGEIDNETHRGDFENQAAGMYQQSRHKIFSEELGRQRDRAKSDFEESTRQIQKQANIVATPGGYADAYLKLDKLILDHEIAEWFGPDQAQAVRLQEFNKLELAIAEDLLLKEQYDTVDQLLNEKDSGEYMGFRYLDEKQRNALREISKSKREGKNLALADIDLQQHPGDWNQQRVIDLVNDKTGKGISEQGGAVLMRRVTKIRGDHFKALGETVRGVEMWGQLRPFDGTKEAADDAEAFYTGIYLKMPSNHTPEKKLLAAQRMGVVTKTYDADLHAGFNSNDPQERIASMYQYRQLKTDPQLWAQITTARGGKEQIHVIEKALEMLENGTPPEEAEQRARDTLAVTEGEFGGDTGKYDDAFNQRLINQGYANGKDDVWGIVKANHGSYDHQRPAAYDRVLRLMWDRVDNGWMPPGLEGLVVQKTQDLYMSAYRNGQGNADMVDVVGLALGEVLNSYGPTQLLSNADIWEDVSGNDDWIKGPAHLLHSRFKNVKNAVLETMSGGSPTGIIKSLAGLDPGYRQDFKMSKDPPEAILPAGADGGYDWFERQTVSRGMQFISIMGEAAKAYVHKDPSGEDQFAAYMATESLEETPLQMIWRKVMGTSQDNWMEVLQDVGQEMDTRNAAHLYAFFDMGDETNRAFYSAMYDVAKLFNPAHFYGQLLDMARTKTVPGSKEWLELGLPPTGIQWETPLTYKYHLAPELGSRPIKGHGGREASPRYQLMFERPDGKYESVKGPDGRPLSISYDINEDTTEMRLKAQREAKQRRPAIRSEMFDHLYNSEEQLAIDEPAFYEHLMADPIALEEFRNMHSAGVQSDMELFSGAVRPDPGVSAIDTGPGPAQIPAEIQAPTAQLEPTAREALTQYDADRKLRQAKGDDDRTEPLSGLEHLDVPEVVLASVDVKGDVPDEAIENLQPEMIEAVRTAMDVFLELGHLTPLITSGHRLMHPTSGKPESKLHAVGYALDFSITDMDADEVGALVKELKDRLPSMFDVVWEKKTTKNTAPHLHIEYQTDMSMGQLAMFLESLS